MGSFNETEAERCDELEGDGGGGIAVVLDSRARGVVIVLLRVGVPAGGPILPGAVRAALGVNGDAGPLGGDVRCELERVGDARRLVEVGLLTEVLLGLLAPETRLFSCFAVMPTYREAREPGVIMDSTGAGLLGVAEFLAVLIGFGRVVTNPAPGVRLPAEGVILPL